MPESAVQNAKKSLGLIWFAIIGVVLVVLLAGAVLGHSESFKEQCGQRKVEGISLGWFKNAVCDLDFELG